MPDTVCELIKARKRIEKLEGVCELALGALCDGGDEIDVLDVMDKIRDVLGSKHFLEFFNLTSDVTVDEFNQMDPSPKPRLNRCSRCEKLMLGREDRGLCDMCETEDDEEEWVELGNNR